VVAEYLKLPEVARRLDVSEKTARRYIKAGELPSVFIGGAFRVTEKDLQEFVRAREVHPKAQAPLDLEGGERRESGVHTAGAHMEGQGSLYAYGRRRVLRIASSDLQAIIRGAVRGELSEDEAMAAAIEKAETT
jgi:excisionase family DNA binding protein